MRIELTLFFVVLLFFASVSAEPGKDRLLRESVADVFPGLGITGIKEAQIPGLYEVMLGTEVIYISEDGRYILQGDLIDLEKRINISEEHRSAARVKILKNIPGTETIDFVPPGTDAKHTVYVFTDITCGYCRRFHQDVAELNGAGVAVRYLAFPRTGIGSASFEDMESVWCAADRNTAMTAAKRGKKVKPARCDNPVKRHYELGQTLGVKGTPAIYLEGGQEMPGYLPPEDLLQAISDYGNPG